MKKIIVMLVSSILLSGGMQAQSKYQKELLLQIAALKVYIEYGQKGYNVVKKGLGFIGDVKRGEVNLHQNYFSALKKVNPKIKNYFKVAEIISMQIQIIKTYKGTFRQLQEDDLFHGNELDYIHRAFDRLLENCNATLNELLEITTDANLEMKDDQRMESIDNLYLTMMDDYTFCQNFCKEAKVLSLARLKENKEVKWSRVLNGL
jgi:hypothetical protein